MKKTLQALAILLALGAAAQSVKAYAVELGLVSAEEQEYKIIRLMDLRKEMESEGKSFTPRESEVSLEFPEVTKKSEYNEELVKQYLRYIKAIEADNAFKKVIQMPEFKPLALPTEPGI
jgi:hypothetical protein